MRRLSPILPTTTSPVFSPMRTARSSPGGKPEVGTALTQAVLEPQGRQHCPASVVLIGNGGAKQGHKTVTEKLIDGALIAVHLVQGELKEAVEERVHGLGPQARSQGGRVGNV